MNKTMLILLGGIALSLGATAKAFSTCESEIQEAALKGKGESCRAENIKIFAPRLTLARTGTVEVVCEIGTTTLLFSVSPAPGCEVALLSSDAENVGNPENPHQKQCFDGKKLHCVHRIIPEDACWCE